MNYRGTDKDGKKYFIEIDGRHATIRNEDGAIELELTTEDFYGRDKHGHAVYEKDTIIPPVKNFTSAVLGTTFTTNGEEITVKELSQNKGMTRGFLSRIISCSELKTNDKD